MEKGKIVQVLGAVIDVEFPAGKLPMVRDALTVELDGKTRVMEVAQHVGHRNRQLYNSSRRRKNAGKNVQRSRRDYRRQG